MSEKTKNVETASLWEWVKAICTLVTVGVVSYKIYLTPIALTVDFPTLLSLLLAMFSVALAALFYFKATETSNTFYDNTYNFTKDIAQLLAKMESGFGEKLRNLDEGYSSMRDYIQNGSSNTSEIDDTKQKIAGEKEEIEKVISERNEIVNELLEKSQLQTNEKNRIVKQLADKESELEASQKELSKMNNRLLVEKIKRRENREMDSGMEGFTEKFIVNKLGADRILRLTSMGLMKKVDDILQNAPHQYLDDLERLGYFDGGFTREGVVFIRRIAERIA